MVEILQVIYPPNKNITALNVERLLLAGFIRIKLKKMNILILVNWLMNIK
jgi:hypothetical protein